jgi:hypothetical protein
MNALVQSIVRVETKDEMMGVLKSVVKESEESVDPSLGRGGDTALRSFVANMALCTAATADELYDLMQKIVVIGFHVYQTRQ